MAQNLSSSFNTSPEFIEPGVLMYVRFSRSLRNVEDLLHERGVDNCYEWVGRFGANFATGSGSGKIRKWRRHWNKVFVKLRDEQDYHCAPLTMKVKS